MPLVLGIDKCSIDGCDRKFYAHRSIGGIRVPVCLGHHTRIRQHVRKPLASEFRPNVPQDKSITVCQIDQCTKKVHGSHYVDGERMYLCGMHGSRWVRNGTFEKVRG